MRMGKRRAAEIMQFPPLLALLSGRKHALIHVVGANTQREGEQDESDANDGRGREGLLSVVEKGTATRATRYRYLGNTSNTPET